MPSNFLRQPYERRQFLLIDDHNSAVSSEINVVPKQYLPSDVSFPVGHPQKGELYVAHPANLGMYVPFNNHELAFLTDKMHELQLLLECLGATKVVVSTVKGYDVRQAMKQFESHSGGVGYSNKFGAEVGYSNQTERTNSVSNKSEATLFCTYDPIKYPYVPNGLTWLNNEPDWNRLIRMRLDGNILDYNLKLNSQSTTVMSDRKQQELKAQLKVLLVNLHYEWNQSIEKTFSTHVETEWAVHAEFRSMREFINNKSSINQKSGWLSRLFEKKANKD
jgi:hypothetical protein